MKSYLKHISINSEKRFGKPCIKDTRISIYDILNWMSNGMTKSEIINDFPELTEEKINACLAFVADRENKTRVAS